MSTGVYDDCFCLIALSRCILTCDPRRSCLPNMFLKNICNERTIEWEVVSVASVISPCCVGFSPCLDVSRIKRLLTDAFIGRVITALLRPGVGGRETVLGIIAPARVTIQVMCPSSLGGRGGVGLVSRWEWLWCYLINVRGHIVACFCRLRIVYKCRVVAPMQGEIVF